MIIVDNKNKIVRPRTGYNNYFDFEKFTPEILAIAHGNHKPYLCDYSEAVSKAYERMNKEAENENSLP